MIRSRQNTRVTWQRAFCGGLLLGLCCLMLAPDLAQAKKKRSNRFVDAKDRFALRMPHGWELAPQPGDLYGMMFRRLVGDVPAVFRAHVEKAREGEDPEQACARLTRDFGSEIGYRKLTDLPTRVAGLAAFRRTHTAFVSGDKRLVRYAVDTVFIAYGHIHFLHFETLETAYKTYLPDLEKLIASYRALVGRKVYGPLIGSWDLIGSAHGLRLRLGADLTFELGARQGRYLADGKRVTFIEANGRETFDYTLGDASLVLRNENLGGPMAYRRVGEAEPSLTQVPSKQSPETLVGSWRVVDGELVLILSPSGSVQFGPLSGRYKVKGSLLTVLSTAGVEVTYHFALRDGRLILSGGDLERPLKMEKQSNQ